MRIIDIPGGQQSEAWHIHRATHRNASDAAAMMGCSPYTSRTDLLKQVSTGITPEPDARTADLYAEGHRSEKLARPLGETIIDDDLYPVVMANGVLSASLDGHTLDGDIDWEHKLLNDRLRAVLPVNGIGGPDVGRSLPMDYRVQIAHQQHCSGAKRTLFTASKWDADGNLIEARHCWIERDEALIADVVAGWAQFEKDVAEFKPEAPAGQVVAAPMEHLPSVSVQTSGALVVRTNLDVFGERLRAFVAKMPKEPETDQDFADLAEACKRLEAAEKAIEAAVNGALASVTDVESMRVTAMQLAEIARTTRLASEKVVKNRKDEIKARELKKRADHLAAYIATAQGRLGAAYPLPLHDFASVIKGLRSLDSLRDKLDTALAQAKIAVDAAEKRIAENLKTITDAGQDVQALFADRATLVQKDPEAVTAIVSQRVTEHRARIAAEDADIDRINDFANDCVSRGSQYIKDSIREFDEVVSQAVSKAARVQALLPLARARMVAALEEAERREAAALAQQETSSETGHGHEAAPAGADRAGEAPRHESVAQDGTGEPTAASGMGVGDPERGAGVEDSGPRQGVDSQDAAGSPGPSDEAGGSAAAAAGPAPVAPEAPTIKLGSICAEVGTGFSITAEFVRGLGFEPDGREKAAMLYTPTKRRQILLALAKRLQEIA